MFLRTQKEVSVGADGTQLSDGLSQSHLGTFQPEPAFTNTGCQGNGYRGAFTSVYQDYTGQGQVYAGQNKQTLTGQHTEVLVSPCSL